MIPQRSIEARADPRDLAEELLVEAARRSDEAAVRELIRRLNPRLFRLARGIVESDAEAEEVVQEAYLTAFTRLAEFRGEARFSTWITRIALNAARMRRRAAHPHEEYDTVAEEDPQQADILAFPQRSRETAEAALGREEVRVMLERAVAALPAHLRLVFLLREAEGRGIMEIARDLELNPITVKTRLFRARRQLRALLETRLQGGFLTVFPFAGSRCARLADRVTARLKQIGWL